MRVVFISLLLFCTSCQMIQVVFFFKQPRFEIEHIEVEEVNVVKLFSKPEIELKLHIRAENRNDFDLRASSDRVEIMLNEDLKIAEALSVNADVPSKGESVIILPVKLRLNKALIGVLSGINKENKLNFRGRVVFNAGSYSHTRDIHVSKDLPKISLDF
jgi:LEA14-like dessication related protein